MTMPSSQFSFHYPMEHSPAISVTGVSLSPTTAHLGIGSKKELIPTVLPMNATDRTVRWTSDNPPVVTVDSRGIVTAVAAGTAAITATTQDGGFAATSVITVSTVPVTGVTLR